MTIPPLLVVIIIAIVIALALGCFCFAMAWTRAEAENKVLRSKRMIRALSATSSGELG
jgi:multisubunit Na+/H+ antiporter MnhC subunit